MALTFAAMAVPASAAPAMTGLYRVGGVGIVEVTIADGQVLGRLKAVDECTQIAPDTPVLNGSFEGNVFVGSVTVCQSGASCVPQKTYPFLGFWVEDELVGSVRVDDGCSSPAVDSGALHVTSASVEDRQRVAGKGGSASDLAQRDQKAVERAVADARALVEERKYPQALAILRVVQPDAPDNFSVNYLMGQAYSAQRDWAASVEPYQRASEGARARKLPPEVVGEAYYNLACALAHQKRTRDAVDALVVGYEYAGDRAFTVENLATDPDLASIRSDKRFRELVSKMRLAAKPQKGKPPR